MTAGRDMLSDELVEAMENLHLYPRLIAERAAKEARRAALTSLRERVAGLRARHPDHVGGPEVQLGQVLAEIKRALGEP